jgi:hypothetical protein
MLAELDAALREMAKKTAINNSTVTTAATIGHCRRSQLPSLERRRSAAARVAAFRARAAAMRSLWFCAPAPTDFAVVVLPGVDFTVGRVAVAVAPFAPPDALPDGRCAPLRLFRFFAMRQILHQRVLAYPHRVRYRESARHPRAVSWRIAEMICAPNIALSPILPPFYHRYHWKTQRNGVLGGENALLPPCMRNNTGATAMGQKYSH